MLTHQSLWVTRTKVKYKKVDIIAAIFHLMQVFTKQSEIGIGQATIVPYRYKIIEYLPWMYLYNFEVESQRPFPITTYDTLTYPFDNWTWGLLSGFSAFVFLFLVFIQKLWMQTTGEKPPNGWLFQGNIILPCQPLRRFSFRFCSYRFRPRFIPHCWSGWDYSLWALPKELLLELPEAITPAVDHNGKRPVIRLQGDTPIHLGHNKVFTKITKCVPVQWNEYCHWKKITNHL